MNTTEAKANQVREMFSSIAGRYDFLNHFLSLGIDVTWRKKAVAKLGDVTGKKYLDVACGTADMAIMIASSGASKVTGVDFSPEMLKIGDDKSRKKGFDDVILLETCDALNLEYESESFDGVTCAFGLRNFADLDKGLNEMRRVLKNGGKCVVLEFTTPGNRFVALIYKFYFTRILPIIGRMVSGKKGAYKYLPDSVYKFPAPQKFSDHMISAGLANIKFTPLTLGICGIHTGTKP